MRRRFLTPRMGLKILALLLSIFVVTNVTVLLFGQIDYDRRPKDPDTKVILTYTTDWQKDNWAENVFEKLRHRNCPYRCYYTSDKRQLYRADVVMFHGLSTDILPVTSFLLKPRPPELYDQIWLFKLHESPESFPDAGLLEYPNVFNWTMTYRHDSDTPWPYVSIVQKNQSRNFFKLQPISLDDTTLRRKSLVVAMISNCSPTSRRLQYVSLMQKYIKVDLYGKCGPAFENSFCRDYITEKALNPLKYGMIPVVRGGVNYSQILPPGSYINVQNFDTIEELTYYLQLIDKDNDLYRSYFSWRAHYEIDEDQECQTCQKFHTFNASRDRKIYANIYNWHHTNNTGNNLCWNPLFPGGKKGRSTWDMTAIKYEQTLFSIFWQIFSKIF